ECRLTASTAAIKWADRSIGSVLIAEAELRRVGVHPAVEGVGGDAVPARAPVPVVLPGRALLRRREVGAERGAEVEDGDALLRAEPDDRARRALGIEAEALGPGEALRAERGVELVLDHRLRRDEDDEELRARARREPVRLVEHPERDPIR